VRQAFDRASQTVYFVLGLAMSVPLTLWAFNTARGKRRGTGPGPPGLVQRPLRSLRVFGRLGAVLGAQASRLPEAQSCGLHLDAGKMPALPAKTVKPGQSFRDVVPGPPGAGTLLAACLLVAIGHGLTREWYPHYPAPIAGPLFVLGLMALRSLSDGRGRPPARTLAAGVVAINALLFLVQLPAYRPDDSDPGRQRARIEARLAAGPQRHLVLVQGSGHGGGNWTANAADVDAAPVVWARDLGAQANRELLDYFSDRRVWRLDSIAPGEPRLVAAPQSNPEVRDR
jgi:hypothetical protein